MAAGVAQSCSTPFRFGDNGFRAAGMALVPRDHRQIRVNPSREQFRFRPEAPSALAFAEIISDCAENGRDARARRRT